MNITLITAGLVFLLNPSVWLWDALPDFLGVLLIMLGIKKIVFLNDDTEGLYSKLWRLAVISAAKTVVSILFATSDGDLKMLTSFIFTALELVFLTMAVRALISTLDSLQTRYCGNEVPKNCRFGGIKVLLTVYTVFRLAVSFLPEGAELASTGAYGNVISADGRSYYPSDSKWAIYILSAAVCLIFLVFVLIFTLRSMAAFKKDKATKESAEAEAVRLRREESDVWLAKRWRAATMPFIAAFILSAYVYFDGVDFFPKAIAAIIMTVLSLMFATRTVDKAVAAAAGVLLFASSVLLNLRLTDFFSAHKHEFVIFSDDAAAADYRVITILMVIQASLLFALSLLFTEILKRARVSELGEGTADAKTLGRQILLLRIALLLALGAGAAYPFLRPEYPELATVLISVTDVLAVIFSFTVRFDYSRPKIEPEE